MKNLLVILLILVFSERIMAQVSFYGDVSYYPSWKYRVKQYREGEIPSVATAIYESGGLSMKIGVEYNPIKKLFLYCDAETFMNAKGVTNYEPFEAIYTVKAEYKLTKIISIELLHVCCHPILSQGSKNPELYGGGDKITIKFKTK